MKSLFPLFSALSVVFAVGCAPEKETRVVGKPAAVKSQPDELKDMDAELAEYIELKKQDLVAIAPAGTNEDLDGALEEINPNFWANILSVKDVNGDTLAMISFRNGNVALARHLLYIDQTDAQAENAAGQTIDELAKTLVNEEDENTVLAYEQIRDQLGEERFVAYDNLKLELLDSEYKIAPKKSKDDKVKISVGMKKIYVSFQAKMAEADANQSPVGKLDVYNEALEILDDAREFASEELAAIDEFVRSGRILSRHLEFHGADDDKSKAMNKKVKVALFYAQDRLPYQGSIEQHSRNVRSKIKGIKDKMTPEALKEYEEAQEAAKKVQ